jgi:hypothetical protein
MPVRFKLSKQELQRFNQDLADCEAIAEDIEQARLAGVPNMDVLQERLELCRTRIEAFKAQYAKDKK